MNPVTALTYRYWMKTLDAIRKHPSADSATKDLAELAMNLIEINKHNPETIAYLNRRGLQALENTDGS